jgi:hypothetical protein
MCCPTSILRQKRRSRKRCTRSAARTTVAFGGLRRAAPVEQFTRGFGQPSETGRGTKAHPPARTAAGAWGSSLSSIEIVVASPGPDRHRSPTLLNCLIVALPLQQSRPIKSSGCGQHPFIRRVSPSQLRGAGSMSDPMKPPSRTVLLKAMNCQFLVAGPEWVCRRKAFRR